MPVLAPVSTLDRRRRQQAAPRSRGPATAKVELRSGVRAPAEAIWEVLYDVPGWASWNPLHTQVEGEIKIGTRLSLVEVLPGVVERPLQLTVVDWVPNEQLHLRNAPMGGWMRSIRFIEIEQLDVASSILSTGELFIGMFADFYKRRRGRILRRGFAAHGEALKAEAEKRWMAGGGGAADG
jgi:hypothetical protein